jgi:ketosteroid isomerase-like protein
VQVRPPALAGAAARACGRGRECNSLPPQMSANDDRAVLAQLQHDWMQAVQERNMDRLEEIVGAGFRFTAVHLHPDPMTREQWMAAAREGYTILSFAYEHMDIDVFGDTGVVHARYSQVASFQHTPLSNVFRLTDVWHRNGDTWQVVARHSSVLG